jgi:hypothetical protein
MTIPQDESSNETAVLSVVDGMVGGDDAFRGSDSIVRVVDVGGGTAPKLRRSKERFRLTKLAVTLRAGDRGPVMVLYCIIMI